MKTLTQCCCGCSLKSGSIIIGSTFLIFNLVQGVLNLRKLERNEDEDDVDVDTKKYIHIAEYVAWTVWAVNVVFHSTLIYGADKEKPLLLKIWLWYEGVILALTVLAVAGVAITLLAMGTLHHTLGFLLVISIYIGIIVYCMKVVHSYHYQLTNESPLPVTDKSPKEITELPPQFVPPPEYLPPKYSYDVKSPM